MKRVTINGHKGWLMENLRFTFRPGCPLLVWSGPDSPRPALCSICRGGLGPAPLMMWRLDGACISLCDACSERWIETIEATS